MTSRVEISSLETCDQRVTLDGVDVSDLVASAQITIPAGGLAIVDLELLPPSATVTVDGKVKVDTVDGDLANMLIALGWSPPVEDGDE